MIMRRAGIVCITRRCARSPESVGPDAIDGFTLPQRSTQCARLTAHSIGWLPVLTSQGIWTFILVATSTSASIGCRRRITRS